MIFSSATVESAAFNVGYASVSQFNREYTRLLGGAPRRDVLAWRLSPLWRALPCVEMKALCLQTACEPLRSREIIHALRRQASKPHLALWCWVTGRRSRHLTEESANGYSDNWMLTVVHHPLSRQRHDIRQPSQHADGPTDATTAFGTKHGVRGILEVGARTLLKLRAKTSGESVGTIQEQPGEENSPNDPKRS